MVDAPILFVAGLGRCGTTMVMTMLDAGGFPVSGPRPAYEPAERWEAGRPDMPWLSAQQGRAVKWLDPTRNFTLPGRLPVRPVVILLTRDAREQARSQIKLIGDMVGLVSKRAAAKGMERSIRRDVPLMRAKLGASAIVYPVEFEAVLVNPHWAARKLQSIVAEHFGADFDEEVAQRVVIRRRPECLEGFWMERDVLPLLSAGMGAQK
jgi:hypothetical protein